MSASDPIISLSHVDAGYPGAVILRDVTFDVAKGEVFALLGGSGCGKSTIMKHLIALNPPLAGDVKVAGLRMCPSNHEAIWRKIGVMYQSGALFGSMTCGENVSLPLEEFTDMNRSERAQRMHELLDAVGLADAEGKMPSEISGGMRKRVAIARAMALEPEIVFLDEPSAGLDPVTSNALDELIHEWKGAIHDTKQNREVAFILVHLLVHFIGKAFANSLDFHFGENKFFHSSSF